VKAARARERFTKWGTDLLEEVLNLETEMDLTGEHRDHRG
jgi:hypothetical protein